RAAMAGTTDIEHADIKRADDAVEMGVDEVQTRRRAPMSKQARLDVLGPQWLAQQRIVEQVDLPDGEVVGGAPVAVEEIEVAACRTRLLLICHVVPTLCATILTNPALAGSILRRHQTK